MGRGGGGQYLSKLNHLKGINDFNSEHLNHRFIHLILSRLDLMKVPFEKSTEMANLSSPLQAVRETEREKGGERKWQWGKSERHIGKEEGEAGD